MQRLYEKMQDKGSSLSLLRKRFWEDGMDVKRNFWALTLWRDKKYRMYVTQKFQGQRCNDAERSQPSTLANRGPERLKSSPIFVSTNSSIVKRSYHANNKNVWIYLVYEKGDSLR